MRASDLRTSAVLPIAGLIVAAAMWWFMEASLVRAAAGLTAIYALGYVVGALLVDPRDDRDSLPLAIVRLIAGLLLTTVGFFLSLSLSLPWFVGPVGLIGLAVVRYRRAALLPPRPAVGFSVDGTLTGLVAALVLSPIVISAIRMAPGEYPAVFFNVDTAYFLEKVHALVRTNTFPPESLGVADGLRSYHFGVHGVAALISRSSGLAPHHSLFLIVLPLLTGGILASALLLARAVSPALPALASVPMLLVSVPTLWYDFWGSVGPPLWTSASTLALGPVDSLTQSYELWGVASNNGQNVAAHFLVLASLAGIAAAPSRGWRLPVFLIGSAIIFKAPAGVALAAGFSVSQAFRALGERRPVAVVPAVAAAAVFALVYGAFWLWPTVPGEFATEVFPLFHLRNLHQRGGLPGFALDVAWLVLPAVLILPGRLWSPGARSLPLLAFAVAPFVVVNVLRSVDLRAGATGDDDWVQIMMPVPLLLRAFVLTVAGQRWARLGPGFRVAFLCAVALAVLPPAFVAARYSRLLILAPERGHEFVDNQSLAEALAVIPTEATVIVTNDLRYPADGFRRDNRQMQIPALFGHQAFAVNYAYEFYDFSPQRQDLQGLLRSEEWSPAIDEAARAHQWTHLLVRKDYPHPSVIPLALVFENDVYSVFRFGSP